MQGGVADMRVVVALGGNALLRRGEPMTTDVQRLNVRRACQALAPVALDHELVVSHGNGPQVGLLALQGHAYRPDEVSPLDVLGAATEGMIGYLIEQELGNLLPFDMPLATILTMTEVDPDDPAFADPTKPIGPVYTREEADRLVAERGWAMKPDGKHHRRVVASPEPRRIFELRPIKWLIERGCVVICAGGGGIPTMYAPGRENWLVGVEAVIDKDRASALLARQLEADLLVLATDVDGVYTGWGTSRPAAHRLRHAGDAGGARPGSGVDGAEGRGRGPLRGGDRLPGRDRGPRRPARHPGGPGRHGGQLERGLVPCPQTFAPSHAGQIRRSRRPRRRRSYGCASSCVLASDRSDSPWTERTFMTQHQRPQRRRRPWPTVDGQSLRVAEPGWGGPADGRVRRRAGAGRTSGSAGTPAAGPRSTPPRPRTTAPRVRPARRRTRR